MDCVPSGDKFVAQATDIWEKTKLRIQSTDLLYFSALFIWMTFSFVRSTGYYKLLGLKSFVEVMMFSVLVLLALDFAFCQKKETEDCLWILLLYAVGILAYERLSLQYAVSVMFLYPAKRIPFQRIAKRMLLFYTIMVGITVLGAVSGVIEDVIFYEGDRVRHSLGFTYCSYINHYALVMCMLYLVVRVSIRLWEVIPMLACNLVLYYFTDTKTDVLLCVFMLVLAVTFGNAGNRYRPRIRHEAVAGVLPLCFLGGSLIAVSDRLAFSAVWQRLNELLNGRLLLSHAAVQQYGISLFGQKIKWIGVGQSLKNPDAVYNYVDNIYLQNLLSVGIVFTVLFCLLLGRTLAGSLRQGYTMRAVVLLVFLLHGLVDPQLRALGYNPFLLLGFSTECICFGQKGEGNKDG